MERVRLLMGIRLRRMMGYGFNDVVIDDPRFKTDNMSGVKSIKEYETITEGLKNQDDAFGRDDFTSLGLQYEKQSNLNLYNFISYSEPDEEFPMSNDQGFFVLVPPLILKEASRFDNTMDWADYEQYHPQLLDDLIGTSYIMKSAPFPYDTNLIDVDTKQEILSSDAIRYLSSSDKESNRINKLMALSRTPYKTLEELENKAKLVPPIALKSFTNWLDIFTDDTVWEDMKPIIVTYFS
jgi:hypothetical protein